MRKWGSGGSCILKPIVGLLLCALVVSGCSGTGTSLTGKDAAIFNANQALAVGDCNTAIAQIEPYYNSSFSDNSVRRVRASAYACAAGMGLLATIDGLTTNNIAGSALWRTITKLFPSTSTDRKMESAWFSVETLMTWLKPNRVIPPEYSVPTGAFNPGSMYPKDREDNANTLMAFTAMALIGTTNYRYGKAAGASFDATFNKQQALPWSTADFISKDTTGCAYAGGIMSMFDAFGEISGFSDPSLGASLSQIAQLKAVFDTACSEACQGLTAITGTLGIDFSGAGCNMTAAEAAFSCATCPAKLRHRSFCNDATVAINKNPVACAGAGVVIMINDHPAVGWPGP